MTDSVDSRDLETIAAFIDRRLPAEERRAFEERLDKETALYEVFVEAVRYRDQQAAGSAVVVEHPAVRRQRGWLGAVAALLAVAVAAPVLLRVLPGDGLAEALVADGRFDPPPGAEWYLQDWSRTRGIASSLPGARAAFRAGVQTVDLEVALRLGRDQDAAVLVASLERTVDSLEIPRDLLDVYGRLDESLEAGTPDEELLELAATAEDTFTARYPELAAAYSLGRWAEAGKLAARSGNRGLLASRSFARETRKLSAARMSWDESVAARIATVTRLLEAAEDRLELARLEEAFKAIIDEA